MERQHSEKEYLASYNVSEYERPSVTVDIIVFSVDIDKGLSVLLIRRDSYPFLDYLALPGGFITMNESLEEAARRKLLQETGINNIHMEQLYTFGDVGRDPRTRVITVAYLGLVPSTRIKVDQLSPNASWYPISLKSNSEKEEDMTILGDEPLAFDHRKMLTQAIVRLRGKLSYTDISFELLKDSEHFAIYELQKIHEILLGKKLDTPNFRRMFTSTYIKTGKAIETGEECKEYAGRTSKYYRYQKI